jgi:hypothetical protein
MAPSEPRQGYKNVKVPEGAQIVTVDKDGRRFAKVGEVVELSEAALEVDPWLSEHVVGRSKEEVKSDPYHAASTESLKEALKGRDLDTSGDKNELINRMKKHGVPSPGPVNEEETPERTQKASEAARKELENASTKIK